MRVDLAAGDTKTIDHLLPIWLELRPEERGEAFVPERFRFWALDRGLEPWRIAGRRASGPGPPLLCARYGDMRAAPERSIILLEHGAGQGYGDSNPANPGGRGREAVQLFLCPNEDVAERNLAAYPEAQAAVIGCPKLDGWFGIGSGKQGSSLVEDPCWHRPPGVGEMAVTGSGPEMSDPVRPVVAFSFHWDNPQAPETRWALPHYRGAIGDLAGRDDLEILGHGHPRAWGYLERLWRELGIEPIQDFEEILARADLYICDNSSTLYEAAAAEIPVLVLNAPWYRRHISHGLRFWDAIPGLECDEPADLPAMLELALADPPSAQEIRRRAVEQVYAHRDGAAAARAAEAIRAACLSDHPEPRRSKSRMPDPYAARRSRSARGAPIEWRFPSARLRRLGANLDLLAEAEARWAEMDASEREVEVRRLANMTDSELRDQLGEMMMGSISALTGIPPGAGRMPDGV